MKPILGVCVSYWVEAGGVFKFWAAMKVGFLGEGTHKLGLAKLRSKPDRGRAERGKQRREHV